MLSPDRDRHPIRKRRSACGGRGLCSFQHIRDLREESFISFPVFHLSI
jgi:hypothetical protein